MILFLGQLKIGELQATCWGLTECQPDFNLDAIFNSSLGLQWILKWKKISSGGVQSDLNHDKFSISGKRQALYSSKSGQHAKPIDSKWALMVIWFWLRLDSNIPEKILSNGMGWAFYMKVSTLD